MTETTSESPAPRAKNAYLIPGAIVLAGILISGSILLTRSFAPAAAPAAAQEAAGKPAAEVRPIDASDHIFGSKDADVFLIEYSDYQCVFCERFHGTVQQIVTEYDGKVAWVYRHLPLDMIHPQARPAAIASECIAEFGGNDAFWKFTDRIFGNQQGMKPTLYSSIAAELGIDSGKFAECVSSKRHEPRIDSDMDNATALGGNGTPFNVLLTKDGKSFTFSGALPIERVRPLVDRAVRSVSE